MPTRPRILAAAVLVAIVGSACSSDETDVGAEADVPAAAGVEVVSPPEAAEILADPPADLVVLDVRSQEEFDAGHIEGAVVIDVRRDDFVDRVAALDRDDPYVVYCRTGNRSARATAIMAELGFTDVTEIGTGIVGWTSADLPVVAG